MTTPNHTDLAPGAVLEPDSQGEHARGHRSPLPLAVRQSLPGVILVFLVLRVLQPVSDPDTFWHIAAGEYLRTRWVFSGPDPWSDMSTRTWRLHEWLPQLGMDALYGLGGLAAVAWLLPVGVASIVIALWYWLRQTSSLLISTVVMGLTFVGMSQSLSVRPHLVSFALTVITTGAWLRTAEDHRARWWLVPVTWLWACSHGMWFVGPVVGLGVVAGMVLDRAVDKRHAARLAAVPVASIVAAAATPVGPQLLLSPFEVSGYTSFVQEWQPAALGDPGLSAFLAMAGVVVLLWGRRKGRVAWSQLFLLALSVGLALMYARTIPLGAAVLAPVAALSIQRVSGIEREPVNRREILFTWGATASALVLSAVLSPVIAGKPTFGANELDAQIAALPVGTNVCNSYDLGGWLIWKHPNIRPAVDGRTEVYDLDYFKEYIRFQSGEPGWEAHLETVGCEYALVSKTSTAASGLVNQEGWTVEGTGGKYALLRART